MLQGGGYCFLYYLHLWYTIVFKFTHMNVRLYVAMNVSISMWVSVCACVVYVVLCICMCLCTCDRIRDLLTFVWLQRKCFWPNSASSRVTALSRDVKLCHVSFKFRNKSTSQTHIYIQKFRLKRPIISACYYGNILDL